MQKIVTDNCKNSMVQILVYGPDPRIRHETFCILYIYLYSILFVASQNYVLKDITLLVVYFQESKSQ